MKKNDVQRKLQTILDTGQRYLSIKSYSGRENARKLFTVENIGLQIYCTGGFIRKKFYLFESLHFGIFFLNVGNLCGKLRFFSLFSCSSVLSENIQMGQCKESRNFIYFLLILTFQPFSLFIHLSLEDKQYFAVLTGLKKERGSPAVFSILLD